jgi:FG-GAP repeat
MSWTQVAYLKSTHTDPGDRFGTGVCISADGQMIAVGANEENNASPGGAVYVY